MFIRTYGYSFLRSVRQKYQLFWCIAFPVILGTLFKVSLGDFNETEYMFHQVPVAYVAEENAQQEFREVLKQLETENELIKVQETTATEAEKLLRDGEIKGIFKDNGEVTLVVTKEGIDTSILKSIQEQYQQVVRAFLNIAAEHPERIADVAQGVGQQWNYLKESGVTEGDMDMAKDYFYALIAMNCLYGCFAGVNCAAEYKANLSPLAARRVVASTNRFVLLLAEISAKMTAQFLCSAIGTCYLRYALGIQIGEETGRIALIILVGSAVGVMTGVFIGSFGKLGNSAKGGVGIKEGICVGVTMLNCFLAGLMVGGMYQWIEQHAPVINRINPAALIVKAFYSLNIYDTYARYNESMLTLCGITVLLVLGSYLLVRRERYASL